MGRHHDPSSTSSSSSSSSALFHNNCYDYIGCFYIRIPYQDSVGIITRVGILAENNNVSIYSILQNQILDRYNADFCITTGECRLSQIHEFCIELQKENFCNGIPLAMPMIII